MGNKASMPSSGSAAAAPGGGGSVASTNSNLNTMNRNLQGILGAASNSGSSEFKVVFREFKATVISCISPDFQGRLLQINDSNNAEAIKGIRDDINAKITALNTQFRQLMAKMQRLPEAIFKTINDKYSKTLSDVYANLTVTLKTESSKAGKLIAKKEAETAKFAASFPAVPGANKSNSMRALEERFAALQKPLGGGRRHAKRKTRKVVRRSHSRRKVAA